MDKPDSFLDSYSPFTDGSDPELPSTNQPLNSGSSLAPQIDVKLDDTGIITKESIEEYQARLDYLERSLQQEEENLATQINNDDEPAANWPRFYPIVYFNIEDIPENLRVFVRESFFCWFCMLGTFGLNWIVTLSLLSTKADIVTSPGSKIALSSLYLFMIVPLALDVDNLAIYRALRKPVNTLTYVKIFLFLIITMIFELFQFIGSQNSGSVGLICTISAFTSGHIAVGVFSLFVTIGYAGTIFSQSYLLQKLWRFYRGTEEGGNMESSLKHNIAGFVVDTLK